MHELDAEVEIMILCTVTFRDIYYFILWLIFVEDPENLITVSLKLIFITKKSNYIYFILFCGYFFTEDSRSLIGERSTIG